MQLSDSSESEVTPEPLSPCCICCLLLSALSILAHCHDDTGASNPVVEEVMSLSSDSEPLPRLKVRRVTRKVSFSHPLAYQDPQFILKRQVHESRRHTRTNKDTDLSAGLPDTTRKRRTEVISHLYPFHPLAGVIRQPLNSSDSNYQETSPSSGDSTQSSLPAFKTVPG